jgi:hypothetical protein
MLDVTSSISIARFEPWTEREGGGQMRSGKRVAKRGLLQRRDGREVVATTIHRLSNWSSIDVPVGRIAVVFRRSA